MEQNLSKTPIKWRASAIVLAICLVLMVVTSVIGHNIQTSGGTVRTEELTFTTDVGATSHAKLYIPETATAETPAPAILLCHGYTASLDAMESNAIELSRRGYVVMALDMYGHGESTLPPDGYKQAEMGNVENYAPDLGSYSALQQFKNYDFIDLTKVGMLGHSMGTAAIQEGAYLAYSKWQAAYTAAYAEALAAGSDETTAAYTAYGAAMNSGIVLPGSMVLTGYNYNVRNINDLTYNGVTAETAFFRCMPHRSISAPFRAPTMNSPVFCGAWRIPASTPPALSSPTAPAAPPMFPPAPTLCMAMPAPHPSPVRKL